MDLKLFIDVVSPMILLACLIIGYIIKNAIPNESINRFIPLILAAIGIAANAWSMGAFNFEVVLSGAASGLAAVGAYEAFRNIVEHFNLESE